MLTMSYKKQIEPKATVCSINALRQKWTGFKLGCLILFWALVFIFAGNFIAIKEAVATIDPMEIATFRVVVALLLFQVYFLVRRKPLSLPAKMLPQVWFAGILLQAIPFASFCWGMKLVSPGIGGIIEGTIPIFVFVFSLLFMKKSESLNLKSFSGLLMGILGIYLIFAEQAQLSHGNEELWGMLAIGIMTASYALGTVFNRKILAGKSKTILPGVLYHQHLASVVVLGAIVLAVNGVPMWNKSQLTPGAR